MNQEDRKAIEDLFGKLAAVERQSTPRDAESEAFIRERIGDQPGAPYYMAQTIVVQEQTLAAANARIAELENLGASARDEPRRSGLFGSLFGGNDRAGARPSPWGGAAQPAQPAPSSRGGGFLAGAAQTAAGVAGGLLLGNAIAGMFGGDEAHAATPDDADDGDGGIFDGLGDEW